MTQSVDCSVVFDLHHGAGQKQLGAGDPPDTGVRRNAGCGKHRRTGTGKGWRIQSRVDGSVHVRIAETSSPAAMPQWLRTCARSGNDVLVIASTRCVKVDEIRMLTDTIRNANHSYYINELLSTLNSLEFAEIRCQLRCRLQYLRMLLIHSHEGYLGSSAL